MVAKLSRILLPLLVLGGCTNKGDDRKPDNARSAPDEQAVLHDAMANAVPATPQKEPTFTNGVRGAPGVTVDQPGQGAAANTGQVAPPALDAGAGGGTHEHGGAGAGTNR